MRIPGVKYVQGRNSYTDSDGKHYGIAIHNTSNANLAPAEGEADYATRRTDGISAHLYVDKDSVIQSLDINARAGHAGSSEGNQNSIAVEITGQNGMSRAWWMANVAWDKFAAALAYVIKNDPDYAGFQIRRASVSEMRSNPKVKAFYAHDDMRAAWGGTTHTDPGPNFPWDHFLATVKAAVAGTTEEDDMNPAQNTLLEGAAWRLDALVLGADKVRGGPKVGETMWTVVTLKAISKALSEMPGSVGVNLKKELDEIDAAVAAGRAESAQQTDDLRALLESYEGGGATAEQVMAKIGEMLSNQAPA